MSVFRNFCLEPGLESVDSTLVFLIWGIKHFRTVRDFPAQIRSALGDKRVETVLGLSYRHAVPREDILIVHIAAVCFSFVRGGKPGDMEVLLLRAFWRADLPSTMKWLPDGFKEYIHTAPDDRDHIADLFLRHRLEGWNCIDALRITRLEVE